MCHENPCGGCRYLASSELRHCAAFPEPGSIPDDIWLGKHQHREPYPGDHGIQFRVSASSWLIDDCSTCKHLFPGDRGQCKAFPEPESIPREIRFGYWQHREPYPGDNGIQFEPRPGTPIEQPRENFLLPYPDVPTFL